MAKKIMFWLKGGKGELGVEEDENYCAVARWGRAILHVLKKETAREKRRGSLNQGSILMNGGEENKMGIQ